MFTRLVISLFALVVLAAADSIAAPGSKEPAKPSSERLRELQRERVKALEEQLEGQFERCKIGKDPMIVFIEAVRELCDAELELADTREKRLSALESTVKRMLEGEQETARLVNAGLQTKQGLAQIRAARLKAQIQLEKLKLSR